MAWEVDLLIAATGGDLTTLNAFEAQQDGEDPTEGGLCKARVKGNTESAQTYWSSWSAGMTASNKIVITADTNSKTDGTDGSGDDAVIDQRQLVLEATNPMIIDWTWLEFNATRFYLSPENDSSIITVANCYFHGNSGVSYEGSITSTNSAGNITVRVGGCLVKDNRQAGNPGIYAQVSMTGSPTFTIFNCTSVGNISGGVAVNDTDWTITATNVACCASGSNSQGTDFWNINGTITETNTKSEDDAEIANTDGVDFTSPSTEDYSVVASGGLDISGTALPSWYTDITSTDMAGTSWAANPSCGCYQVVAAGGGFVPYPNPRYTLNAGMQTMNGGV